MTGGVTASDSTRLRPSSSEANCHVRTIEVPRMVQELDKEHIKKFDRG
jgi:hypothetical protein